MRDDSTYNECVVALGCVGDILGYDTNTLYVLMLSYVRTDLFVCVCVHVDEDVWIRTSSCTSTVE